MVPFSSWGERLDFLWRMACVYSLIAALFILSIIALPPPFTGLIKVPFILIAIYYWSINRPTLLPPYIVFLLGLCVDIIGGGPLGVNALIFYLVYWVVTDQRGFLLGQSFIMIWLGFGILNACAVLARWVIYGLLQWNWPNITIALPEIALSFIAFPFVAILLHLSHKILPPPQMPLMRRNTSD